MQTVYGRRMSKGRRKLMKESYETEEEAVIRRSLNAQRMAKHRARKKKAEEEARALSVSSELMKRHAIFLTTGSVQSIEQLQSYWPLQKSLIAQGTYGQSTYTQLLGIIERLGMDIRLTYAGSRTSLERLKVGIAQARILIRECLLEIEMNSNQ